MGGLWIPAEKVELMIGGLLALLFVWMPAPLMATQQGDKGWVTGSMPYVILALNRNPKDLARLDRPFQAGTIDMGKMSYHDFPLNFELAFPPLDTPNFAERFLNFYSSGHTLGEAADNSRHRCIQFHCSGGNREMLAQVENNIMNPFSSPSRMRLEGLSESYIEGVNKGTITPSVPESHPFDQRTCHNSYERQITVIFLCQAVPSFGVEIFTEPGGDFHYDSPSAGQEAPSNGGWDPMSDGTAQ